MTWSGWGFRPRWAPRRFGTEGISEGVLHIAHRQSAHEPGDHKRFQRIRLGGHRMPIATDPTSRLLTGRSVHDARGLVCRGAQSRSAAHTRGARSDRCA